MTSVIKIMLLWRSNCASYPISHRSTMVNLRTSRFFYDFVALVRVLKSRTLKDYIESIP